MTPELRLWVTLTPLYHICVILVRPSCVSRGMLTSLVDTRQLTLHYATVIQESSFRADFWVLRADLLPLMFTLSEPSIVILEGELFVWSHKYAPKYKLQQFL